MDADCVVRQRDQLISRREKRWSMNSQRLEEILAELMKPISDVRRSFDTDLSSLLEEYLTEAGLRALDADEHEDVTLPNFAELALLLQQSANIYGRKVDALYQHVVTVSDSLHHTAQELERCTSEAESPSTPSGRGRQRKASSAAAGGWGHIVLDSPCARRESVARPPPTLPRMDIALEPRDCSAADAPLTDYSGETIGLLDDFHCTRRLQGGVLVNDLERWSGATEAARSLRPLSLVELQAAIVANAPPPPSVEDWPPASPLRASTPHADTPPVGEVAPLVLPGNKSRKRRNSLDTQDILNVKLRIIAGLELGKHMVEVSEFSICKQWIVRVIKKRKSCILSERLRLMKHEPGPPPDLDFIDFDSIVINDDMGFTGWSEKEATSLLSEADAVISALSAATKREKKLALHESDDDGFFEQSSVCESEGSRHELLPVDTGDVSTSTDSGVAAETAWAARVVQRAGASEARGVDVRRQCARVTAALQLAPDPAAPRRFTRLLHDARADHHDVSTLMLATLFLANAGNVDIIQGPPLSVNSFSVKLLSTDERLYTTLATQEEAANTHTHNKR